MADHAALPFQSAQAANNAAGLDLTQLMHSRADVLSDTKYEDEGDFHAGYEIASSHACALLPVAVSPG